MKHRQSGTITKISIVCFVSLHSEICESHHLLKLHHNALLHSKHIYRIECLLPLPLRKEKADKIEYLAQKANVLCACDRVKKIRNERNTSRIHF